MSINPQLIPIKKDSETIRKTVLTNIVKMLTERGWIKRDKMSHSINKVVDTVTDDNQYKIELDVNVKSTNNDKTFEGRYVVVKLIPQKVTGFNKSPLIKDFLDNNIKQHKIIVFDGISEKAKHFIENTPNVEVFIEPFFMINIIEHIDSPQYQVMSDDDIEQLLKTYNVKRNQLEKIQDSDPICKYYNLKRGNILRIIRNSEQTGIGIAYRIVVKGSSS